jgi:3-oxoacyl-[acyl-carrier-protein] synthase-3
MATAKIENISITGLSCVLPTTRVDSVSRYTDFGKDAVDKIISKTGVESIYRTFEEQTASDLAFVAAQNLFERYDISPESIGALVLVTQTPDYRLPATACVLQHRLKIPEECVCFDINLGCSGYLNGLYTVASLMKNSDINRALLLVAETPTKRISPLDRSLSMIFGDCGTATLLEKDSSSGTMSFQFKTFGERFKKIIVPAGGYRNRFASSERVVWPDGNIRSEHDTYMNGQDVFSFSILEVPQYIEEFIHRQKTDAGAYDYFILHQANQYILKQIAKKLKISPDKLPISMKRFGNTSSTSIPLTLAFLAENNCTGDKRCLLSGFGVGLSWAAADITLDSDRIMPITHSDDYFTDGAVSHE